MPLTPDREEVLNGLKVYEFNLLSHNDNKIDLPKMLRKKTVAITVHNTEWIQTALNTTPAEQYVRATYNGNMRDCRVNYYVDNTCAWRCLPDGWVNWSCADGCSNPDSGNNTSIAIEVIGNSKEAEENAIKLIVTLMKKYNLNTKTGLRTHSYWMNVRDGKKGSIDQLNVMKNAYKNCPIYILPHWEEFKNKVALGLGEVEEKKEEVKPQEVKPVVKPTSNKEKINVYYRSFAGQKWWSEIKNYNNDNAMGYSGVETIPISAIAMKSDKGQLTYRVHVCGGGWLNWITKYNTNDWYKGVAGFRQLEIDAIQIELSGLADYQVRYRVSTIYGTDYFPWVEGTSDYAGVFGKPIDKVQIEIVG